MKLSRALLCLPILVLAACSDKPTTSPLLSGINIADIDHSARPQDDFNRYANGHWLDRAEIPPDKTRIGIFITLRDKAQEDVRKIIDDLTNSKNLEPGSDDQRVADFFSSYMNMDRRNALGIEPIKADIDRIRSIKDKAELFSFFGYATRTGIGSPVSANVNIDAKNSTQYTVKLSQSGLGLPDRDYYLNDSERFSNIRTEYLKYIKTLFSLAAIPDASDAAERILALETQIAQGHWTRVQNRDRDKTYNKLTVAALNKMTGMLDWSRYLDSRDFGGINELVIRQPDYLVSLAKIIENTPLADWKTYLTFHLLDSTSSSLTQAFDDAQFAFRGTALSGQLEQEEMWKRGVKRVDRQLGEIVGKIYVKEHFQQAAKDRMQKLVENLRTAYAQSIDEIDWMTDETKKQAKAKLSAFTPKIGYPDIWRDYSGLTIAADDLVGNLRNVRTLDHKEDIEKLGGPIRKWEWGMTPQTVNAYYNPSLNEIVFPAAILQPPFFNMQADDAANYGSIGAVIGHEMGHGFDDQGSKSDGDGNLRDWWTDSDREEFKKRTSRLVDQYSAYRPFEDLAVNGELTLGENIGDLAGLTIAYKAYQISLNGKPAPVIDGLTGDQRFFLNWAQSWQSKTREKTLRQNIATDPHSPPEYRIIGPLSNLPQFLNTFDVKPGDAMYLPPEQQVKIW